MTSIVRSMSYSSSLTDEEWEILEPLLPEVLPKKKKTKPLDWSYRELIDGVLYRLKNGCNWEDLPKDLPPYSTVYWHYKQWRAAGTIEKLMTILHEQARAHVLLLRRLDLAVGGLDPEIWGWATNLVRPI